MSCKLPSLDDKAEADGGELEREGEGKGDVEVNQKNQKERPPRIPWSPRTQSSSAMVRNPLGRRPDVMMMMMMVTL